MNCQIKCKTILGFVRTNLEALKNVKSFWTRSVYYLTKTLDRQKRPVISNDGWEHTISDIVTLHNYDQYGTELLAAYADKEKTVKNMQVAGDSIRTVFAKGNHYKGQPIIISEFQ